MRSLVVTTAQARVEIPARDLAFAAARSSGPGGQNVNKVASKVELRFDLPRCSALSDTVKARLRMQQANRLDADGKLLVTSQRTREQPQNLEDARDKLAAMIARALLAPKPRRPTKPTRASKRRRLEHKRRQAGKKQSRATVRPDD